MFQDAVELFCSGGLGDTRLVFINACHSEAIGREFVKRGVPHVVAIKRTDQIMDDASLEFSKQFYLALLVNFIVESNPFHACCINRQEKLLMMVSL